MLLCSLQNKLRTPIKKSYVNRLFPCYIKVKMEIINCCTCWFWRKHAITIINLHFFFHHTLCNTMLFWNSIISYMPLPLKVKSKHIVSTCVLDRSTLSDDIVLQNGVLTYISTWVRRLTVDIKLYSEDNSRRSTSNAKRCPQELSFVGC